MPQPQGGGGTLSGDTNGPANANETNSVTPDTGGTNVPLGDFTSDPAEIRPVVRASAGGDIETVSLATLAAALPATESAFDYIITSRADLAAVVAPVGDAFNLPSGSYAIKDNLTLNANEYLVFPAANEILWMGMGPGKKVTSSGLTGQALLEIEAGAIVDMLTCTFEGNDTDVATAQNAGTLRMTGCRFDGGSGDGFQNQSTGETYAVNCVFVAPTASFDAYQNQGGDTRLIACELDSPTQGNAFRDETSNDGVAYLTTCKLFADGGSPTVRLTNTDLDIWLTDCQIRNNDDNDGIQVGDLSSLSVVGGEIRNTGTVTNADGIQFENGGVSGVNISGVFFQNWEECIIKTGTGDVNRATISNCDMVGASVGIQWSSGDIPPDGLLILGVRFNNVSTQTGGFNENTSDVNMKCNSANGGLLAETSIVP
ncbi:MAG: hypothetical protein K0U84_15145 [Actinomycetia bacterium]|nr:hypothetical protein [Actinomycetes bacterium]